MPNEARRRPFTNCEREVVALFAQGFTGQQVASQLGIPVHTAHHHIKYAKKKVRARNVTHLVAIAIRNSMI